MDIDLAAFRLNALSLLTSSDAPASRVGGGGNDFMSALTTAQSALPQAAGARSAADALSGLIGGGESSRVGAMLDRLEASNSAFLQRYNARVEEIGDEATVLSALRERVAELGQASEGLERLGSSASDADIRKALGDFIERYNAWDAEFDPYFEKGALLDENKAGEVARFSLRREVSWIFHGAGNGGFAQGLTDMGVSFTPDGQLKLDEATFNGVLGGNREAALTTLNNMARAFGDAAEMLASDGHLLDRRIDNATRAVSWAADNQASVEAEFGPGAVRTRFAGRI